MDKQFKVVLSISSDVNYRRLVLELMCTCSMLCRHNLDIHKFIESLVKSGYTGDTNDGVEVLTFWSNMEESTKNDIIIQSTEEFITLEKRMEQMSKMLNESYEELKPFDYDEYDVDSLKHKIKYAKNPMEKKALQRQLNSAQFMSGKHRKGRKR